MNKMMRPIPAILAFLALSAMTPLALSEGDTTFRGEIADTQCALNVHSLSRSHQEMIAMEPSVKSNGECARFCVKNRGGRFVLQHKNKVYRLDKPDQAEPFAGQQVKVVGTLDSKTNTITMRSIAADTTSPSRQQ